MAVNVAATGSFATNFSGVEVAYSTEEEISFINVQTLGSTPEDLNFGPEIVAGTYELAWAFFKNQSDTITISLEAAFDDGGGNTGQILICVIPPGASAGPLQISLTTDITYQGFGQSGSAPLYIALAASVP